MDHNITVGDVAVPDTNTVLSLQATFQFFGIVLGDNCDCNCNSPILCWIINFTITMVKYSYTVGKK
eukprot:328276-Amphidinium_carterae.1